MRRKAGKKAKEIGKCHSECAVYHVAVTTNSVVAASKREMEGTYIGREGT